jgi:hypothetical protein
MSKFNLFSKFAQFLNKNQPGGDVQPHMPKSVLKKMRPPRYKPAFSMGHRGFPKGYKPCGTVPAPTIDQVRKRERAYMTKIHVKQGLMYFAEDGAMFTIPAAKQRRDAKLKAMAKECGCDC